MSCEFCTEICVRRNEKMTESHKSLCEQNEKYAEIWDKRFGIADETIIPESFKKLPGEDKIERQRALARRSKANRPARRSQRRSNSPQVIIRPGSRPTPKGLGDAVEGALTKVGITTERVEAWLGRPCGCKERKAKLNRLSAWAKRIVGGDDAKATEYFEEIVGEDND